MARKSKKEIERLKKEAERKAYAKKIIITYSISVLVVALMIFALAKTGVVGKGLYNVFRLMFGDLFYLVIGFIILMTIVIVKRRGKDLGKRVKIIGTILAVISLVMIEGLAFGTHNYSGMELLTNFWNNVPYVFEGSESAAGGILGALFLSATTAMLDYTGTYIVVAVIFLLAIPLLFPSDDFEKIIASIINFFRLPEKKEVDDEDDEEEKTEKTEEPKKQERKVYSFEKLNEPVKQVKTITLDEGTPKQKHRNIFIDADEAEMKNVARFNADENFDNVEYNRYEGFGENDVIPSSTETNDVLPQETEDSHAETEMIKQDEVPAKQIAKTEMEKQTVQPKGDEDLKTAKPYVLPDIEKVLDKPKAVGKSSKNQNSARAKGELLIKVLEDFGIKADLVDIHIGPSVTKFEVKPEAGIKVNRFHSIQDNLMMELEAKDIRIEAPIPGKQAVGIEIPNEEATMVTFKELMVQDPDPDHKKKLWFALGKDLMGKSQFCRLDKMPHLLIAGQTGSGKSVCMNTIICTLLLRTDPDEVKILLVDPKKVEFTPYATIPHLIGPIVNDPNQANLALQNIVQIMDERYNIFSQAGARNIETYNEMVIKDPTEAKLKPLPYIVVIIDELADLMTVAGKEVETSIQRITQLARAAGIHLIVATQRPSVNVITGVIKANIPSRIAFNVSSAVDSRTILDQIGAERLLGHGDMLYFPTGEPSPIRIQGVYVTDDEIGRIVKACADQRKAMWDDHFIRLEGTGNENTAVATISEDPLYDEIKEYVIDVQKASASLLQRRFGIGFNRAARMIDQLEENGVIGPQQGSKPREVYIKKEMEDE